MVSVVIGIVCFAIFLCLFFPILPWDFLHLTEEILYVLKGVVPLFIVVFGLLSILIGVTDIIDRCQAKKEMKLQEEFEKEQASS